MEVDTDRTPFYCETLLSSKQLKGPTVLEINAEVEALASWYGILQKMKAPQETTDRMKVDTDRTLRPAFFAVFSASGVCRTNLPMLQLQYLK